MTLDCQITEALQRDFNALWKCRQLGETLEISTPYLLPNSTLFSLFLTQRGGRFIACDGGVISDLLNEHCPRPGDEMNAELRAMAGKFRMKEGAAEGRPLFFKDCTDPKLISSIAFDVANFAVMATSALVSATDDESGVPLERRFETRADQFLKSVVPPSFEFASREIPEVPGVRFGAVLTRASRVYLVSYVTGSNPTYFRRSVCDTAMSFKHAWHSSLANHIGRTIPVVNTEAAGYDADKLRWHFDELKHQSHSDLVRWDEKDRLAELLG